MPSKFCLRAESSERRVFEEKRALGLRAFVSPFFRALGPQAYTVKVSIEEIHAIVDGEVFRNSTFW
jgi:hypothetical protein